MLAWTPASALLLVLLSVCHGVLTARAIADAGSEGSMQTEEVSRLRHGSVLVTGATGRTGSQVYEKLKGLRYDVRALVRNASKAAEVLDCDLCDESEGIYVGDITDPEAMHMPMVGVKTLVILTSSYPMRAPNGTWYFPDGGYPKDIDWLGSNNQVKAALTAGVQHVILVSSMGTTEPDTFLDKLGDGHALFYKLNGEVDLMGSGLAYTIIKPGGLLDTEGGKSLLIAGHNDDMEKPRVTRADVASVIVAAIQKPHSSRWLRFDLSCNAEKPATHDFQALFDDARAWGRE